VVNSLTVSVVVIQTGGTQVPLDGGAGAQVEVGFEVGVQTGLLMVQGQSEGEVSKL
jgi:hypothetical protein